ncbi:MAG: hypothetical protein H7330_09780 [Hymenobacteraceae bacterium]|nr:hypothetical protein [Hymenobacteraceae bacterium]
MSSSTLPKRRYQCRIDEIGPTAQMLRSSFVTDQADFGKVSPDFKGSTFLTEFDTRYDTLDNLVQSAVQRVIDAEVTKTMNRLAKSLREPLNLLEIRVKRAAKKPAGLTVAAAKFNIGKVRTKINNREMEGLDGALKTLLQLVADNAPALTAQGQMAADTKVFADARAALSGYNTTQNDNMNAQLTLTVENMTAANALWELMSEIMEAGRLMYQESQPRKAVGYMMARLKKRMRQERAAKEGGE